MKPTVEAGRWRAIALMMLPIGRALLPAAAGVRAGGEATAAAGVPVVPTPVVGTPSASAAAAEGLAKPEGLSGTTGLATPRSTPAG